MSAYLKAMLWAFLFGVTAGGLMAISIKYPVPEKAINEANGLCSPNHGLDRLKVGLSGKVYFVKCKNGKTFDLK